LSHSPCFKSEPRRYRCKDIVPTLTKSPLSIKANFGSRRKHNRQQVDWWHLELHWEAFSIPSSLRYPIYFRCFCLAGQVSFSRSTSQRYFAATFDRQGRKPTTVRPGAWGCVLRTAGWAGLWEVFCFSVGCAARCAGWPADDSIPAPCAFFTLHFAVHFATANEEQFRTALARSQMRLWLLFRENSQRDFLPCYFALTLLCITAPHR